MGQHFHIKRDNQIHHILEWLETLPKEQKNGVPIHHIQSFQVVSIHFHSTATGYVAIVLCRHTDHPSSQDNATIEHLLEDIHS